MRPRRSCWTTLVVSVKGTKMQEAKERVLEQGPGYQVGETKTGLLVVGRRMSLAEAFPQVDPGGEALGGRVLIQLRAAKQFSDGGIALPDESQDYEKSMTAVGKVIQLGQIAYCDRNTGERWPEGAWVAVGDFCRIPKWGGDRWEVVLPEDEDKPPREQRRARFVIYNDREIIGRITGDPMKFIDYI